MKKKRPKHLALHQIRQPLPAIVSILHRISGFGLFLLLPLLLWLFQGSLRSIETYTAVAAFFAHPLAKLFTLFALWAFLHHLCSGLRYLAIDLDIGVGLASARASARWVIGASLAGTLLLGAMLW